MQKRNQRLTRRQSEVLFLAARGFSNAEIAAREGITANSVAEVLSAAYRRLGARDRAHAVVVAHLVGDIDIYDIEVPIAPPKYIRRTAA